jgi:hypothetical protein
MYLAGPIAGLTYGDANEWRQGVADIMPDHVHCLSPLRGKDFLSDDEEIQTSEYSFHPLTTDKGLTRRNMFDINRSRIIFINLIAAKTVSIGTMIELGALKSQTGKLIILAMEEGNIHDHPMVRELADYVVPTIGEAITIAREIV